MTGVGWKKHAVIIKKIEFLIIILLISLPYTTPKLAFAFGKGWMFR